MFPDSPHVGQFVDDFAALTYRRLWIDRAEVESHLCEHGDEAGHEHQARIELEYPGM